MIPTRNFEVYASLAFFILTKIICFIAKIMYNNSNSKNSVPLSSIPENEEQDCKMKWVPKKKHEVLKAKYKCLKKLFQIYDASVIGILPEQPEEEFTPEPRKARRKRSHRTKTDACAGTNEIYNGDVITQSDDKSIASAVIRDLNIKCSCSTQMLTEPVEKSMSKVNQLDSKNTLSTNRECECTQTLNYNYGNSGYPVNPNFNYQHPAMMFNEKRKPTRFQMLMQRIFGLRREKPNKNMYLPTGHLYAASDNNISHHYDRRRRRGLRFRRVRRPKKCHSDLGLTEFQSPTILSYVQSIQRSCLMDTTARHCPIVGCQMIFYGIINYNDHLNLCHFIERKFICHYCHEGFERECDKFIHENEHLGINKLGQHVHGSATSTLKHSQKASITQTDPELIKDVPEEKLKKIVSFFDKIVDNEQMIDEFKKNRFSETHIHGKSEESQSESESSNSSDKRTVSCGNLMHRKFVKCKPAPVRSEMTNWPYDPVKCHFCGEHFDYRRQLSLHVDLEHRMHDKFSKFHSCAGITNHCCRPKRSTQMQLEAGKINVQSSDLRSIKTSTTLDEDFESKSESLSCDPSTNIVYYDSNPSKTSAGKIRSGISSYKWEPGTKIIRV